jgi:DNA recombination protein RmuC
VVTDEARQLFEASRELHGRLARMAEHIEKLGRSIERSVKDYNLFVGSLERQVLPSARKLTRLDPSKPLAAPALLEEQRRELTAYDLLAELEEATPRHRDDDALPELEATPRAS